MDTIKKPVDKHGREMRQGDLVFFYDSLVRLIGEWVTDGNDLEMGEQKARVRNTSGHLETWFYGGTEFPAKTWEVLARGFPADPVPRELVPLRDASGRPILADEPLAEAASPIEEREGFLGKDEKGGPVYRGDLVRCTCGCGTQFVVHQTRKNESGREQFYFPASDSERGCVARHAEVVESPAKTEHERQLGLVKTIMADEPPHPSESPCACVVCALPRGPGWAEEELRSRLAWMGAESAKGILAVHCWSHGARTESDLP